MKLLPSGCVGAGRSPAGCPPRERRQRGVALLIAMMSMALLTLLVIEFTYEAQVDYRRSVHWLQARRAELLAASGVALAAELLATDAHISTADTLKDLWALPLPPLQTADGIIHLRISDENALLNLNLLGSGAHSAEGQRFAELVAELELDLLLAGALADWIDRNDAPSSAPEGAESAYYMEQEPSYTPRNAPLRSFGELGLIRGFGAKELAALRAVATVLPPEHDRVNPNDAPPQVLRCLDPALYDGVLVDQLIAYRQQTALTSSESILELDGWKTAFGNKAKIDKLFRYTSSYFRVLATGQVDDVFQSVEALLYRDLDKIRVVYWLARRGPNIAGADSSAAVSLSEADLSSLQGGAP